MFKKYLVILAIFSIVLFVPGCITVKRELSDKQSKSTVEITYYSQTIKNINVIYNTDKDEVTVITPEGKRYELPRAIAASGIRYTKDDQTVFWSKGPEAQFWLDGKLIFSGEENLNH